MTGFLACAGNMFLCLVFQRKRSLLQKPYNIIIFTLGIIDLLTGKFVKGEFSMAARSTLGVKHSAISMSCAENVCTKN